VVGGTAVGAAGDIVTLADTENRTGMTGTAVTAAPGTFAGYTHDPAYPGTAMNGTIAGDGSLVLELYYTANPDTAYTVEHYTVAGGSAGAAATLADTQTLTGTTGTLATATPGTFAGYTYDPAYPGTATSGLIAGDGSLVLELYYTANPDTAYTVEHYTVVGGAAGSKAGNGTGGTAGSEVGSGTGGAAGGATGGTTGSEVGNGTGGTAGGAPTGTATVTLAQTEYLTGTTGTFVTATPGTFAGYTHAPSYAGTPPDGIIAGGGSGGRRLM
jgi:hypothetical protein